MVFRLSPTQQDALRRWWERIRPPPPPSDDDSITITSLEDQRRLEPRDAHQRSLDAIQALREEQASKPHPMVVLFRKSIPFIVLFPFVAYLLAWVSGSLDDGPSHPNDQSQIDGQGQWNTLQNVTFPHSLRMAMSKDGTTVAILNLDLLQLYSVPTWNLIREVGLGFSNAGEALVTISLSGHIIAIVSDHTLRIYNSSTSVLESVMLAGGSEIRAISMSSNGTRLALGGLGGIVSVMDYNGTHWRTSFRAVRESASSISLFDSIMAIQSNDTVEIFSYIDADDTWKVSQSHSIQSPRQSFNSSNSLSLIDLRDGKNLDNSDRTILMAACTSQQSQYIVVVVRCSVSESCGTVLEFPVDSPSPRIDFSTDGRFLAIGDDTTLRLYDGLTANELLFVTSETVHDMSVSRADEHIMRLAMLHESEGTNGYFLSIQDHSTKRFNL